MTKTTKLVYTAVLVALSVVGNIFTIPLSGSNALSFTYFVCFIAGWYLGVVPGIAVGFVGDLLGHLIAPFGAYNPFVALSSTLLGLIPALVHMIKGKDLPKLFLSFAICAVVCTAGLNTFGLWWMFIYSAGKTKSFWVYLVGRLPFQAVMVIVNCLICVFLVKTDVLGKYVFSLNVGRSNGKDSSTPEDGTTEHQAQQETNKDNKDK